MNTSFFFYDLETSGVNPREARIMQFAGQRTDMQLNPIGEPVNVLVKLSEEVVPDPDAIFITGITPQQTIADGITEADFLKLFYEEVALAGTIFVGYNTVRFDDEFMRYLHYRNFYDPYEWQYVDQKSRWDLLDVVRMTRALRPEGMEWPVDDKGTPTNRLELITKANNISHIGAHDALSDVNAVIDVARLIQSKQPKLFDYLLKMRDKKAVAEVVQANKPFLYTSGKYDSAYEKTAAVVRLADHPKRQGSLVYDLRYDPTPFATMTAKELAQAWRRRRDDPELRLPIKTLQYNRCPAVAPLAVLDQKSAERLDLSQETIQKHHAVLQQLDLAPKVLEALKLLDDAQQAEYANKDADVDAKLYDGFFGDGDKNAMRVVRSASKQELSGLKTSFTDSRLTTLLPRYKARNYPSSLSDEERAQWEAFKQTWLMDGGQQGRLGRYFARLAELASKPDITPEQQFLIEELQLYGQSIVPFEQG